MPAPADEAAVFNAARKIAAPADRRSYLDAACGTDPGMRDRVHRLLAAHDADTGFLAAAGRPTPRSTGRPTTPPWSARPSGRSPSPG